MTIVAAFAAAGVLAGCTPSSGPAPSGPTVPSSWESAPSSCANLPPSVNQVGTLNTPYACRIYFNVSCFGGSTPNQVLGPGGVTSWTADGGSGTHSPAVPLYVRHDSATAALPDDGPATDPVAAAVGLLGLAGGDSFTVFRSTSYRRSFECVFGTGQFGTSPSVAYLFEHKRPVALQCQKTTILSVGGVPAGLFGVGDPYACNASGSATSGATPAFPIVVGSGYWGPGYICAPGGAVGVVFSTTKVMPYGYPLGTNGNFRQVSPGIDTEHLNVWESGIPLSVPKGTVCDARNQGRVDGTKYGTATPVPAGWNGPGFICNPSGSLGKNGSQTQVFFPQVAGTVAPFLGDTVVMYYNGTPWALPRADVCV